MAGSTMLAAPFHPPTGNQPSHSANTMMSAGPTTNVGSDTANSAKNIVPASASWSFFKAARLPRKMPITVAKISATAPRIADTGIVWSIRSRTSRSLYFRHG